MASFGGLILTNKGRALQAKAQAGVPLVYTRIGMGDGNLGGQSIPALTALINAKKYLPINKITPVADGQTTVSSYLSNAEITTGFYFRELGLFANDPNEGEILYCYGNAGAGAEYIPSGGGPDIVEKYINVVAIVANAANVSANIDNSLIFVEQTEFDSHTNAAILDHPDNSVTDSKIGNRTISDTTAPTSNTGLLSTILSGFAYMIKAITGKANWRTAPRTTLENAVKLNGDTMSGDLRVTRNAAGFIARPANSTSTSVIGLATEDNLGVETWKIGSQPSTGNYGIFDSLNTRWTLQVLKATGDNDLKYLSNTVWHAGNHGNNDDPHNQYLLKTGGQITGTMERIYGVQYRKFIDVSVFQEAASNLTGIIKIDLPVSWNSTMLQIKISGYNYTTTAAGGGYFELNIGGYNYMGNPAGAGWNNGSAVVVGTLPTSTIRLAHDGSKCCILIGSLTTAWNFPKIQISEVTATHAGATSVFASGWAISRITAEPTLTNSVVIPLNAYTDSDMLDGMHAITAATPNTVAARNVNGDITARAFHSTMATGTPPMYVASSTMVTNFNSNWLAGYGQASFARAHSASYQFGGSQTNISTNDFIEMIKAQGALTIPYWVARGSWSYATNQIINDTGVGNIHLAGCVVEAIGHGSAYTIRITLPNDTNGGAGAAVSSEFIYINNGSGSTPGWRKLWNSSNDGAGSGMDSDLLDGMQSSTAATPNTIVSRDGAGNVFSGLNITGAGTSAGGTSHWSLRKEGVQRFQLGLSGVESGTGNTGANLGIWSYSDTGGYIGTPLSIDRASLAVTLGGALSVPGRFTMFSPAPIFEMNESDQGTNEKRWWTVADGKMLQIRTLTDAGGEGVTAMSIVRGAGTAVTLVDFPGLPVRAATFQSLVGTGTAPFTVASTTQVPNLNSEMVGGKRASDFALLSDNETFILSPNSESVTFTKIAEMTTSVSSSGNGLTLTVSGLQSFGLNRPNVDLVQMSTRVNASLPSPVQVTALTPVSGSGATYGYVVNSSSGMTELWIRRVGYNHGTKIEVGLKWRAIGSVNVGLLSTVTTQPSGFTAVERTMDSDTVDGFHAADLAGGVPTFSETGTGTNSTFAANFTPAFTKTMGRTVRIKVHADGGPTPTLEANGTGAAPIRKPGGSAAKLLAGGIYTLTWDATASAFILQGEGGDTVQVTFSNYIVPQSMLRSTPTPLSLARHEMASASVGNYALFAGGSAASGTPSNVNTVDAYDVMLTRSSPTPLSATHSGMASASIGNYALFAGGISGYDWSAVVNAYDKSTTRFTPTGLTVARSTSGTSVGDYALFAGGLATNMSTDTGVVDTYNSMLTRSTATSLSTTRSGATGGSVGNYALFAGGAVNISAASAVVDAYHSSLTRNSITPLSVARRAPVTASVGDYVLYSSGAAYGTAVDAYNSSLVRTTATPLSITRNNMAGASVGDYALFGGGLNGAVNYMTTVDAYDKNLTRTTPTPLSIGRVGMSGASVGNHALFVGGKTGAGATTVSTVVDAYGYYNKSIQMPITAGSVYNFGSGEVTAAAATLLVLDQPVNGYIKYKEGAV